MPGVRWSLRDIQAKYRQFKSILKRKSYSTLPCFLTIKEPMLYSVPVGIVPIVPFVFTLPNYFSKLNYFTTSGCISVMQDSQSLESCGVAVCVL